MQFWKDEGSSRDAGNAAKKGKEGIFICDRIKLVQQAIEEFDKHGIEAGVIQGWNHPRSNWTSNIQIASIQTLARRRNWPMSRLIIVDEAHIHYKTTTTLMEKYSAVPVIGLICYAIQQRSRQSL